MQAAVPWARLVALIEPFDPKGKRGRPPLGVGLMLRVYFLQQWYALAGEALEDAIHDSRSMRALIGGDVVPDTTMLLGFRHLLEEHDLKALAEGKIKELTLAEEKTKAKMRALVEHPFHVLKNLFGHRKTRDKGLAKNTAQHHTLFALANLVLVGRTLRAEIQA